MLAAIRGYQLLISHHFAGSCRFLPSCSEYSREAIEAHGVIRGGGLALGRLARCHPLCKGGCDPVPTTLTKPTVVRANAEPRERRRHWSRGWGPTTK